MGAPGRWRVGANPSVGKEGRDLESKGIGAGAVPSRATSHGCAGWPEAPENPENPGTRWDETLRE